MKAKVIDVKYRKDSKSFPNWMRYEITLLYENGKTEKIPAYGKDLQDALGRVVHDQKVNKISKRFERIPLYIWLILWFSYLGVIVGIHSITNNHWVFIGGIIGIGVLLASLNWWGRSRNYNPS
jgi:hypothetical protein